MYKQENPADKYSDLNTVQLHNHTEDKSIPRKLDERQILLCLCWQSVQTLSSQAKLRYRQGLQQTICKDIFHRYSDAYKVKSRVAADGRQYC